IEMISFIVGFDLGECIQCLAVRSENRICKTVVTGRQTNWLAAAGSYFEKRGVCVCVGSSISVCRRDEYDCVAFRCPNRIEFFAGVGDAAGETTLSYELCSGE